MNSDYSNSLIVGDAYPVIGEIEDFDLDTIGFTIDNTFVFNRTGFRKGGIPSESTPKTFVDVRLVSMPGSLLDWFGDFFDGPEDFAVRSFTLGQVANFSNGPETRKHMTLTDYGIFFPCRIGTFFFFVSIHNGGWSKTFHDHNKEEKFKGVGYIRLVVPVR